MKSALVCGAGGFIGGHLAQGVRGRNSDNRLIREKLGWRISAQQRRIA